MSRPDEIPNPYRAPAARLDPEPPGGRLGWRIYFWLIALSAASSPLFLSQLGELQLVDLLELAVVGVALVGVYGYAHRKPIANARLWKLWLPLQIACDLVVELYFVPRGLAHVIDPDQPASPLETALGYLVLAPFYIALFRYAFRSPELWMRRTPR